MLIAFKVSFDEIVGSLFWSSAREQTLPVIVFGMVQYEVTPQVNSVGTLMIAVTLSVLAVVELLRMRRRGR
jgi:spermidine/putrescine transport system permease protein